jgi:hypothetical protein
MFALVKRIQQLNRMQKNQQLKSKTLINLEK